MKTPVFYFALVCALCCMTMPAEAKNKKKNQSQEQRIQLGIWEDAHRGADVDSIIRWMKPLDDAGIKNYYICGSPEEVKLYIAASKQFSDARIHAWMFTVNAVNYPETFEHPEWFEVNRLGYNSLEYNAYVPYYKWLSPSVPEARQFMKNKAASYVALEGLTSVHLDYIRYCDVVLGRNLQQNKYKIQQDTYRAEYDYGYHPLALEKFKKQFGYSPLDLKAPWMSSEWLQFRLNEITTLVNEIVEETHDKGKKVSAAVFPYPTNARMTVYQDWSSWNIDIVCPMNYQSFYSESINWIGFCVENGLRETRGRNVYVSGLFVSDISKEELYQAAKISIEAGANGINFFNAGGLMRDDKLEVVRKINEEYNK